MLILAEENKHSDPRKTGFHLYHQIHMGQQYH